VISAEDEQPVIGASVLIKGTTLGTITGMDGDFTLSNVPSSAKHLQVSYIGMKTQEVAVKSGLIRIILQPDSEVLDEVVVTGMQSTDKRLFTGASTKLSAGAVKLDGIPEISRALEGRASGVSVQNVSGTFGTAPKIRVRGATSIYGSSKPLWVVDGVIMEDVVEVSADDLSSGNAATLISSDIAGLNADDIETFDILKDGSATSIYGARAMAGVIVVTTKKGKAGTNRISYTGEFTMRLKPRYDDFNIMNSQEQMEVYQELYDKGWLNMSNIPNRAESGVYGKLSQLITANMIENTQEAMNAYLRQAEYRNTDWFSDLFQSTLSQNHAVSFSSGTEKASYYASLSAMVDPGWSQQSKVNRYTANLNANYNLSKWVSMNIIGNASYRQQKAPGTLASNVDVVSGEVRRDFDINPYSYAMNTSRVLDPQEFYTRNYAPFNIIHELENNYMDLNVVDLKFQAELKYKPVQGLELSALGAAKYSASSREHNITDFSNQAQAYRAMPNTIVRDRNSFLFTDKDLPYAEPISVLPNGGIYRQDDNRMLSYDFRATASYKTVFNDIHIMNLFGGMEVNSVERRSSWYRGWGLQYSMGEVANYAYEVFKQGKQDGSPYYEIVNTNTRSTAFFFNGTYSYKGRYTLNGTFRYEGTNRLGKSRQARWLPTWNISGAWNVHEENFFKALEPALSHLALKASYSLTADRGPADVTNAEPEYVAKTIWRPSIADQETVLSINNPANASLTYEKKHELNIGASFGFLENRINLEFDWYKRNNYDLIAPTTTQGWDGFTIKYGNVANMSSNGVEFTLSTKNIVTKDFTWSTDIIYSHSKNKVTKMDSQKRIIDLVAGSGFALEGYPVRSIFSIPFRGLNDDGIPTFLDQDGNETSTGIYFQEREKTDFLEYSGSADPTDFGSFGNTFTYKNLTLNVFMTYSFGNVVRLDQIFADSYTDLTAMPKEFKNRWALPGEEKLTDIPTILSERQVNVNSLLDVAYNSYNYSSARIAKGDFIRLKEVSLSYNFPQTWVKKLMLSNLSLKLQATNLFLLYADKKLNGQDPEFFNTGGVAIPVPRQFTLTLRVGL
jgi:TonB-linked SusC/RagA family outer membrane protein